MCYVHIHMHLYVTSYGRHWRVRASPGDSARRRLTLNIECSIRHEVLNLGCVYICKCICVCVYVQCLTTLHHPISHDALLYHAMSCYELHLTEAQRRWWQALHRQAALKVLSAMSYGLCTRHASCHKLYSSLCTLWHAANAVPNALPNAVHSMLYTICCMRCAVYNSYAIDAE